MAQSYSKAAYWCRKAAQQGHPAAQYCLGLMYRRGQGLEQDPAKSAGWHRKAAEHGHQAAQFNLADSYDRGVGVPHDPVLAYVWFALAGAKGAKYAVQGRTSKGSVSFRLALSATKGSTVADNHRNRLALKLTPAERETAEQLAQEYYEKYVLPYR